MHTESPTLPAALAATLRTNPTGPLLTYYDEASGERTELSATTLDNWVSKTANMLVDGCGATEDDTAVVLLPAHWQSAAVLLGCLAAGVPVRTDGDGPAEVAFTTTQRLAEAHAARPAETYLLGLAPMAMPVRDLPPDTTDYVLAVRAFGDHFTPPAPTDPAGTALAGTTPVSHGDLLDRALRHGTDAGLMPGGRLLVGVDADPDPLAWLFAPLATGASVVLCRNASPDRLDAIAAAERVTARA